MLIRVSSVFDPWLSCDLWLNSSSLPNCVCTMGYVATPREFARRAQSFDVCNIEGAGRAAGRRFKFVQTRTFMKRAAGDLFFDNLISCFGFAKGRRSVADCGTKRLAVSFTPRNGHSNDKAGRKAFSINRLQLSHRCRPMTKLVLSFRHKAFWKSGLQLCHRTGCG